MPEADVITRLRVEGEDAYQNSMRRMGQATTEAGAGAESTGKGFGAMTKNVAMAAGGALVAKKGFDFLKGAANDATTLAKSTAGLTRQTGMDTRAASAWVSMTKERGIESRALTTSFTAFSKQLSGVAQGAKGPTQAMQRLGVDIDGIKNGSVDMQGAIGQVSNAFKDMPDGADKSAMAVKLFGRQGLSLLPILNSGSDALDEQMRAMQKAGLTMDKDGSKKALDLAKSQREMQRSMDGVKVSIGQAVIPIIARLAETVLPVIQAFASLINKSPILTTAVTALAIAFGAIVAITKAWTIAQAAFNVVMSANPIALVVIAVVALIAGLVIAYQKVGWFRDGVDAAFGAIKTVVSAVFDWVKSNWPLLLAILTGPIGAAVIVIVKNFDKIKGVGKTAFDGIKTGVKAAADFVWKMCNWIVDRVKELPGKIAGALGSVGSSITGALSKIPGVGSLLGATGKIVAAQSGATMGGASRVLVGERGPELLTLPSGSRINPLPPASLSASQLGPGSQRPVVAQVFLERRMIAEAMASYTAEQQAAR